MEKKGKARFISLNKLENPKEVAKYLKMHNTVTEVYNAHLLKAIDNAREVCLELDIELNFRQMWIIIHNELIGLGFSFLDAVLKELTLQDRQECMRALTEAAADPFSFTVHFELKEETANEQT